jgi:hypothetical protein
MGAGLLSRYDGSPDTFHHFRGHFNGNALTVDHVRYVYAQKPLTRAFVNSINPALTLADLEDDIVEIGYPRGKQ